MNYETMTDDELRIAIAERLGWTKVRYWTVPTSSGRTFTHLIGDEPSNHTEESLPCWPTDIGAAWRLVRLMNDMPDYDGVCIESGGKFGWECYLMSYEGDAISVAAATPERAICLAFLASSKPAASETTV